MESKDDRKIIKIFSNPLIAIMDRPLTQSLKMSSRKVSEVTV